MLGLASCKPGTPKQYIQPGDMEDILVEYHMACALAQQEASDQEDRNYRQALYVEAVLRRHGVTKADFDSSLVYYYKRADRFESVYKNVAERLEEQALVMGASESEIGKYASLNASGDTANIWNERATMLLLPKPPYHLWEFSIDEDSLFRRGDRLLLQFMADFMFQDGSKNALAYLCIDFADTVVSRNIHFSASGLNQLNFETSGINQDIHCVRGFFYLGGGEDQPTTTRLLFMNNVQLIRFHTQSADYEPEEENAEADSLQQDSVGRRLDLEPVSGRDSARIGAVELSLDTGAAPHRVAPRLRPIE